MEGEYEQIREQALQEATVGVSYQTEKEPDKAAEPEKAAELEGAEQSVEAISQKVTDAEQSVEVEPQKPKKAKAAKKAEAQEGSAGGTTERPPRQSVLQETTVGVAYQKQPKEKPPRMICEGCGRSYSIHTKRHVCKAPKGFEKKENVPSSPTPPAPPVGPVERQITLADVTQFLFAESKARREKRRDDLLSKMF